MNNFDFVVFYGEDFEQCQPVKVSGYGKLKEAMAIAIHQSQLSTGQRAGAVMYVEGDRTTRELHNLGFPPVGNEVYQLFQVIK